jgi:hypothetical protein
MIRMSVPFSRRCVAKLWRSVCNVTRLVYRRPAGGLQHGRLDRVIFVTTRKQIKPWPGEPPVGAQDASNWGDSITLRSFAALPWRAG